MSHFVIVGHGNAAARAQYQQAPELRAWRLTVAADARELLASFQEHGYDVAVLDEDMPFSWDEGIDLAGNYLGDPGEGRCPVVVLTDGPAPPVLPFPVRSSLAKPVSPAELAEVLRAL